jgi:hypothetical protein
MKKQAIAVAIASALAFAGAAHAQRGAAKPHEKQAVVTVQKVDPSSRIIHVKSRSDQYSVHLAPEIDISQVKVGSRYRVNYFEPVATAVEPGAQPAAAGATRHAEPGAKAGEGAMTGQVSGVVEYMEVTVRDTSGGTQTFKLDEGVAAGSLKPGEAVTISYKQAVASRVLSTPDDVTDPVPARY